MRHSTNPFPGLRSFASDDSEFFFGREREVAAALEIIALRHIVAVVGRSGSGKSSLVQAGLIPLLLEPKADSTETAWSLIVMRPGTQPLSSLEHALVINAPDLTTSPAARMVTRDPQEFRHNPSALYQRLNLIAESRGQKLLLVVDQFEEIFRHADDSYEDANCFVQQLLSVARRSLGSLAVLLCMRSDFIGECDGFPNLAEAVSTCALLLPRLSEEQLRDAIVRPLERTREQIEPQLLTRLIEDLRGVPDQLSVLQNTLRTARAVALASNDHDVATEITVQHYESVGTVSGSINFAAEQILHSQNPLHQPIVESLFRALGTRDTHGYFVRRPTALATVSTMAEVSVEEAIAAATPFTHEGFVTPGGPLSPDTILDISHEAILRNWHRLSAWIDEETGLAAQYQQYVHAASLWQSGSTGLYQGLEAARAKAFLENPAVNSAWAAQYSVSGEFDLVARFLRASIDADNALLPTSRRILDKRRTPPRKIFISYRREDSGYAAFALYTALWRTFGADQVFFDLASIPAGADFRRQIEANIRDSAILVAIMGNNWLESRHASGARKDYRRIDDPDDYVRIELELALAEGVSIIPVLVGTQTMPTASQLPPSLVQITKRNAAMLHFGPELQSQSESLLREIAQTIPRMPFGKRMAALLGIPSRNASRTNPYASSET